MAILHFLVLLLCCETDDGELLESTPAEAPADSKLETQKSTKPAVPKKANGARALDRGNGEAPESGEV